MDKKTIEQAFMRLNEYMDGYAIAELASVIVESKEAIVIEAESIHASHLVSRDPYMEIHLDSDSLDIYSETYILLLGHPLPEGKALAIILPLEKEDD